MKADTLIALILQRAQVINKMHQEVQQTAKKKAEYPEAWNQACHIFDNAYDNLAFPGGLKHAITLLKQQDPSIVPIAITYLKADPYYFRSGYNKQIILRLLKKYDLTQHQIKQLQDIIIIGIKSNNRFEYQEYSRLAHKIKDPHFEEQIEEIIQQSNDKQVVRRAQGILDLLRK